MKAGWAKACRPPALLMVPLVLVACARPPEPAPVTDASRAYRPASPCNAELNKPQMTATNPAVLPTALWDSKARWQTRLRFRVDESGTPVAIRATVSGVDGDPGAIEQAVLTTMAGYRFCPPVGYSTRTEWFASMLFVYQRVGAEFGGGEMYIQQFVPAYSRAEVSEGRAGTVKVRGTFGQNGRPITVGVASSSGDGVLDNKSLEAMASYQLSFRPGSILTRPVVFEQPYTYEIR